MHTIHMSIPRDLYNKSPLAAACPDLSPVLDYVLQLTPLAPMHTFKVSFSPLGSSTNSALVPVENHTSNPKGIIPTNTPRPRSGQSDCLSKMFLEYTQLFLCHVTLMDATACQYGFHSNGI
jgi:hypothetical protein